MTTPPADQEPAVCFQGIKKDAAQGTLYRLLKKIDVEKIESIYIGMLRELIGKKKFKQLLHKETLSRGDRWNSKICDERMLG